MWLLSSSPPQAAEGKTNVSNMNTKRIFSSSPPIKCFLQFSLIKKSTIFALFIVNLSLLMQHSHHHQSPRNRHHKGEHHREQHPVPPKWLTVMNRHEKVSRQINDAAIDDYPKRDTKHTCCFIKGEPFIKITHKAIQDKPMPRFEGPSLMEPHKKKNWGRKTITECLKTTSK